MPKKGTVRIIRDVRDANRDYWISANLAKKLFDEGKLIQIHVYNNEWVYATKATGG